jgi:cation transport ATPase
MPIPEPVASEIFSRPLADRVREHRYRCAQSLVFGIPVVVLQYLGPMLGGSESGRWMGLFQALLAGWVVYVAGTGLLIEGVLMKRVTMDLVVAVAAGGIYGLSVVGWIGIISVGHAVGMTPRFHWVVLVLAGWTGIQWCRLSQRGGSVVR